MKLSKIFVAMMVFGSMGYAQKEATYEEPKIVGVPPSDAGRGLVRISDKEIRHYSGTRADVADYLVSEDNGLTWTMKKAPQSYPKNYGGIPKESPAIVENPNKPGEFIRVQPINGFVFISEGGIDGTWRAVTKDGKLESNWKDEAVRKNLLTLEGIMRTPLYVKNGKRIIIPYHVMANGTKFHISDDGGKTWRKSKGTIVSPRHEVKAPHQGVRWFNNAVEATVVELKGGKLWALVRTSMDQAWESYSADGGDTWSKAEPSRFFGTLTMNTLARLQDGALVSLWTNTMALPENAKAGNGRWEDVFTNRDSHHIAMSKDNGKTWYGFREIIIDEHRNHPQYATLNGPEDRGKHQSEVIELDEKRLLISLGQHKNHRRLVIVDRKWVEATGRKSQTGCDMETQWTTHTYIPKKAGHCSYNRKNSVSLVPDPADASRQVMQIRFLDDDSLINRDANVDYRNGGATWNFPNGVEGRIEFRIRVAEGSQTAESGVQVSLTDRLFNACDVTTKDYALFTFPIKLSPKPHILVKGKKAALNPNDWNKVMMVWKDTKCKVLLNGKAVGIIDMVNKSPNGASYIHFISTGNSPDSCILLDSVRASVKRK